MLCLFIWFNKVIWFAIWWFSLTMSIKFVYQWQCGLSVFIKNLKLTCRLSSIVCMLTHMSHDDMTCPWMDPLHQRRKMFIQNSSAYNRDRTFSAVFCLLILMRMNTCMNTNVYEYLNEYLCLWLLVNTYCVWILNEYLFVWLLAWILICMNTYAYEYFNEY